jgi:predicted nucleic acid-binding protein
MLRLSDISSGATVFVDANVPLAAILSEERFAEAEAFLRRVASQEIVAVTSVVVVSEVFHRALIAETCEALNVTYSAALRCLKDDPSIFHRLFKCYEAADEFSRLCDQVLMLDQEILTQALQLSKEYGLLVSDATHVALMAAHGLVNVASFDQDLKRAPSLKLYGVQ